MASWTQVEIREGTGWLTGVHARKWMEDHHPQVMPTRKQSGKFIVVLKLEQGFIFGDRALLYLEDLLGADFRRKPQGRSYQKQGRIVRRRLQNVVRAPQPKYVIQLQLLNCNRAFTAINPRNANTPWRDQGVQERLQALGYLYTPLSHPSIARDAEKCFEYYKAIRQKAAGDLEQVDNARAVQELIKEIRGNLVTTDFPESGEIFDPAKLPARTRFAALRFPGGYCTTKSAGPNNPRSGDYVYNQGRASAPGAAYDFGIGDSRHLGENKVFTDNPKLGRFFIRARVMRKWPDNRRVAVADAPVLFQLVDPEDPVNTRFAGEPLPSKVMDYRLIGTVWVEEAKPTSWSMTKGLNDQEWAAVWHAAHEAYVWDRDDGYAATRAGRWLEALAAGAPVDNYVSDWWTANTDPPRLEFDPTRLKDAYAQALANQAKPSRLLTTAEWDAFKALVAKAVQVTTSPQLAEAQARQWVDRWAQAPRVTWDLIQDWWPSQNKRPYPSLRNKQLWIDKAKERVVYLLSQRLARETHQAEISNVGQRRYMRLLEATNANQTGQGDPQRFNAPEQDYGGKAGAGIGEVFELGASSMGLANVTDPNDQAHAHAVRCVANAQGYAGVVFTPSHLGGDRYRLRIYVDPAWLNNQPAGQNLADRRTGTFVVWRNIRLGKYLKLPAPQSANTPMSQTLQTTLNWGDNHPVQHWRPNNTTSDDFGKMYLNTPLTALDVFPNPQPEARYREVPTAVVTTTNKAAVRMHYRPVSFVPDGFAKQFKRAYCELIDDSGGQAQTITRQQLRDALAVGQTCWDNSGRLNKRIHWPSMVLDDATSPFLLTFRSFDEYNALVANMHNFPALAMNDAEPATEAMQAMVEGMLEHFAGGGVLPGITLVHVPRGQTWDYRALNLATPITSGYGTASRAFWLSHTHGVYHNIFNIYGATSNAIHEIGHVLGLCHQPPAGGDIADAHQPGLNDPFQKPNDDQVVCVMSYSGCYGDYCGKCLLQLRGWASAHHW